MEVFPTCVRQSGLGIATFVSQALNLAGPYVIYLGATDLKLPYLIMFLICSAGNECSTITGPTQFNYVLSALHKGSVATFFLPETLGRKLPETINEASMFGVDDKLFSFRPQQNEEENQEIELGKNGKVKGISEIPL